MNTYIIKIDDLYFAGKDDLGILVAPIEKAKKIEGNFNLKSYIDSIYQEIRNGELEFQRIEIIKVSE